MRFAAPLLALLAGCSADCLPEPLSPERQALRNDLRGQVHYSQCPGRPSPSSYAPRIKAHYARKSAFLARVARSRFAPDLTQARREDEEWNRNVNEADCMIYPQEMADEPENVEAFAAEWALKEKQLADAEARFERLNEACPAG